MGIGKEKAPLCSVCCLSYKHSKFIRQNIESIWNQTYDNIEIIALDDGSPDGSSRVLKELKNKSPWPMKVIAQKNSGNIAKNMNILLSSATGKYIVLVACDDKLYEDTIRSKIDLMEKNDNVVFVVSKKHYEIGENDTIIKEDNAEYLASKINNADELLNIEYEKTHTFFIQNAVFRKQIIDEVGGFDEDLLGDDIVLRVKIFLHMQKNPELSFKVSNDIGFFYRIHENNIHKNSSRQIKLIAQVLERYFPDRETPRLFKNWIRSYVELLPFEENIQLLFLSPKCSNTFSLLDKETQDFIMKKIQRPRTFDFFSLYMTKSPGKRSVYLGIFGKRLKLFGIKKRRK